MKSEPWPPHVAVPWVSYTHLFDLLFTPLTVIPSWLPTTLYEISCITLYFFFRAESLIMVVIGLLTGFHGRCTHLVGDRKTGA